MDDDTPRDLPEGIGYLWRRVAGDIRRRIEAGEFAHGARLPSRDDLALEYGVGERTVRRALRELPDHVTVLPAKGAYVTWAVH